MPVDIWEDFSNIFLCLTIGTLLRTVRFATQVTKTAPSRLRQIVANGEKSPSRHPTFGAISKPLISQGNLGSPAPVVGHVRVPLTDALTLPRDQV